MTAKKKATKKRAPTVAKPSKTREVGKSGVEAELRRVSKEAGQKSIKFASPANRGVPDRIQFKGLTGAIEYLQLVFGIDAETAEVVAREAVRCTIEFAEVKAPGKKPTDKQARVHAEFAALGLNTVVIDTKELVREYVRG